MVRSPRRLQGAPVLLTLVVLGLAGCGGGGPASPGAETPEIGSWVSGYLESIRNDPDVTLSFFEELALADSWVSDEEYREAQDLFSQCMADRGWEVTIDAHSTTVVGALDGPNAYQEVSSEDFDACQTGTLAHIQPVYLAQNYNPEGLSREHLIRDCLSKIGSDLAARMTDEELNDLWLDFANGQQRVDVAAALCLMDPTGEQGLDEQGIRERLDWGD